ncbi:MAG: D-aminoacyl-tRNA deacylase [Halanaerobiales bacterium]
MRAVVQRVSKASVDVGEETVGKIGSGLLVFLGIGEGDSSEDIEYLVDKILNLRIFPDDDKQMNLSVLEEDKEILLVPQFTLYGDCRQGRRPSFSAAASPGCAEKIYQQFVTRMEKTDLNVETGKFQALMNVSLINDGPVTMLLDSRKNF